MATYSADYVAERSIALNAKTTLLERTIDFAQVAAYRADAGLTALASGDVYELFSLPAKTLVLRAGYDVTKAEGATATMENTMTGLASSAKDALQFKLQMEAQKSAIEKQEVEKDLLKAQKKKTDMEELSTQQDVLTKEAARKGMQEVEEGIDEYRGLPKWYMQKAKEWWEMRNQNNTHQNMLQKQELRLEEAQKEKNRRDWNERHKGTIFENFWRKK